MKLKPIMIAVALCCLGASAHADETRRPYIVQLGDKPVASYSGGVSGYQATKPGSGKTLDLTASHVQLYQQFLAQQQASVLQVVASAPVQYRYQLTLNGFAAMLTDAEVRQLKARSDVTSVVADGPRHVITGYTPTFLGLDKPDGLWSQLGGKLKAGEDVVIGIIDTGVSPESLSYADRVDAKGMPTADSSATAAYGAPPATWHGGCTTGEGFETRHCNNKLIGARYFADGFMANESSLHWSEYLSARDSNGHGTHTSTTAGGNSGVSATVSGVAMGSTSGMAPRARLAAYKVCWSAVDVFGDPANSCYGSDSVAAIEQAIHDGVNVLNYSISGGWDLDDPVDQAFLHAANAGVFVAAAAGNEGPSHFTLSHVAPWLTTVAASTHDRQMIATLTLGDGRQVKGQSLTDKPLPQTAIVMAEDVALPGADKMLARLCYSAAYNHDAPVLDPDKAKGKIVVCRRAENPRLDKSQAVKDAGGVGMVLIDFGSELAADAHVIPSVHLTLNDGESVASYMRSIPAPMAAISAFAPTSGQVAAPVIANFSSRGPGIDMSMMKPDLAAPGVNVLAGVAPLLTQEQRDKVAAGTLAAPSDWAFYSGTSMATPHVAGIGALLHQLHPDWSPAAIKSALMTSTTSTLPDKIVSSNRGTLPWAQGAGQITPNRAADPGLVYDAGAADYAKYLCNAGQSAQCSGGTAPSHNLNLASITVHNAAATQTITRRVTNVGSSAATFNGTATLPGHEVTVSPASLTLAAGASASYTVTLKRTTAMDLNWYYGAVSWSNGSNTATIPLQVTAGKLVDIPTPLLIEKTSGMKALSVYTAANGKLTSTFGGLKPVTRSSHEVAQAPFATVDSEAQVRDACLAGRTGVTIIPVTFPAGTMTTRFELFDRDTGNGGEHDLDLALLNASGEMVRVSRLQGSNESVTFENPPPGAYRVCVVGNWVAGGSSTSFELSSAIVTPDNNGTLKASLPGKTYAGAYASVGLSWSGLQPDQRYLGALQLSDTAGNVGTTTISVDTTNPVPVARLHKAASARTDR
jgi:hypothetical protein